MLVAGMVVWVYAAARDGSPLSAIIFSLFFTALVLSGYDEMFFLNVNQLTKALLASVLLYHWPSAKRRASGWWVTATGNPRGLLHPPARKGVPW